VLINNAALQDSAYLYNTLIDLLVFTRVMCSFLSYDIPHSPSPEALISDFTKAFSTNVLGPILTTNAFLPLLRKGSLKKVITLNTGLAAPELVLSAGYSKATSYSISKSALEMVNIKYARTSISLYCFPFFRIVVRN
jgi:NAD(P)-dependent dehydrogenase (short-subunit alcohol dehydrogenase family)